MMVSSSYFTLNLLLLFYSISSSMATSEPRPRVEFVPDFMLEQNETAEQYMTSVECDNEERLQVFDGDEYLIQSRNFPDRPQSSRRCTFGFAVQPGVGVSLMCSSFNVPCVWRNFMVVRESNGRRRSFCSGGSPSRVVENVEIPIDVQADDLFDLTITHFMWRRGRGRGFSCMVRGLGGARRPGDDDTNDNEDDSNDNEETEDEDNSALSSCGVSTAAKIVGGSETDPNAYPWMAALQLGGSFCGGSLINSQWILTAAHCSVGRRSSDIFARLGCHRRSCGIRRSVSRNVVPSTYSFPTDDIALLKLTNPLSSFSTTISPVCLPNDPVQVNSMLTVTGWGLTASGNLAPTLKSATLRARSDASCLWSIDREILCTAPLSGNTCNGDSGSAVVQQTSSGLFVQHGVVSFGAVGCPSGVDSGHAEVVFFVDSFIRPNVGQVFLRDN